MNIEFIFAYFLTPIAKWHWNKKKWTKHVVLLIWVSADDLALECSLLHAEQIAVWGPNYEIFLSVTLLVNSNLPRQTLFIAKSSQNTFGLRAVHLLFTKPYKMGQIMWSYVNTHLLKSESQYSWCSNFNIIQTNGKNTQYYTIFVSLPHFATAVSSNLNSIQHLFVPK